jgi:tetratricopeptide (TPR) repeat protein/class 3 adenylate cyclase
MRNVIPRFIHDRYKEGDFQGDFEAVTMFMDISGFTPITEQLMKRGKEGAEVLSVILNTIFIPVINTIYERDGFISAFEGDAFTIIFPLSMSSATDTSGINAVRNALNTSIMIQRLFRQIGFQDTGEYGKYRLSVKVGLSFGLVKWGIVGFESKNQQHVDKTYFFRGEAIDGASDAEHQCDKGDIVIGKSFRKLLELDSLYKDMIKLKEISSEYYLITDVNKYFKDLLHWDKTKDISSLTDISREVAKNFFSDKVLDHKQVGEFRDVVSVFISFRETESISELNELVGSILERVNIWGGFFEGLNFGDKGGNMLVLFGAPVSYEDNPQRAMNFILGVRKDFSDMVRAGVTYGEVYSGIKGSFIRCMYGVIGDVINLSARFMMKANWGEIWLSKRIVDQIGYKYRVAKLGDYTFKGKSGLIEVFKLIDIKSADEEKTFEGSFFGRHRELSRILNQCDKIKDNGFGGIIYIYGEAGIGKSRLLYEVREKVSLNSQTYTLQTDSILRKSMNPFSYFFTNYFEQAQVLTPEKKAERFETIYDRLIESLKNLQAEKSVEEVDKKDIYSPTNIEELISELLRTKSLIASLIGIHIPGSLYDNLPAKARFENTLDAIKEFFKAESLLKTVSIFFEDLHWVDEDSRKVIYNLTWNIEDYPIIIIVSSRFNDDGSKPVFELSENIDVVDITLTELESDSIRDFVSEQLGGDVNIELLDFIQSKTSGNPFYIEQFCLYLKDNDLLDYDRTGIGNDKRIRLKSRKLDLPKGINSVIISRIDRLSSELKEAVLIASVLGNEFDIEVFYEMLEVLRNVIDYLSFVIEEEFDMWALSTILRGDQLDPLLSQGESERVWHSFSKLKYNFRHTLLREVAYDMQPRKRLQNLHRIAAESIEKVHDDEENHYTDLAFHYEKAEVRDNTKLYLRKAGDHSARNYKNEEALSIYDRLLMYVDSKEEEIEVLLKKAKILDLIGKWDEAIQELDKGIKLAKEAGNSKREAELKVAYGKILQEASDYDGALYVLTEAKDLAKFVSDKKILGYSLDNIGEIYRLKGDYDTAMANFQKSLVIDAEIGDKLGASDSLNNIGNIYRHKHHYDKALECHLKSISIKESIGDRDGISLAYNNIGIIYWNQGDYDKSLEYLQKSLEIKELMGNKRGRCISLYGLGVIYRVKGEYDKALERYRQSLELNEEVGDKRGVSVCKDDIGIVYMNKGDYKKAISYYKSSLSIKEQIGSKGEFGHTYSYLSEAYFRSGKYKEALRTALLHFENIQEVGSDFEHGRTHLITAMVLAYAGHGFDTTSDVKPLLERIEYVTSIKPKVRDFFDYALKSSRDSNYLNTLVPVLYEYGKYQYLNGNEESGMDKLNVAYEKAKKSNMIGELNKIKTILNEDLSLSLKE